MKVEYQTTLPSSRGYIVFKALDFTPCCAEAGDAHDEDLIVFAAEEGLAAPCLQIVHSYVSYGETETNYYAIEFCPFCGIKIEYAETRRLQRREVTEKYEELVTSTRVRITEEEVPIV